MEPILGQRFAGEGLGNGNLILMMGKNQIAAGGMNVHSLTQIPGGHCRTFNMPSRSYISPVSLIKNPFF